MPNSVLRVLSDTQGALCFLVLEYLDWLALQLMPDTAETVWLDRHGQIWLVNADGSTGRKMATVSTGQASITASIDGMVVLAGSQLTGAAFTPGPNGESLVLFQTMEDVTTSAAAPVTVDIQSISVGAFSNLDAGTDLSFVGPQAAGITDATVVALSGGTNTETDDELRARILERIQQPPMGGDADDYVQWALAVPGVTRAWCAPNEMGIGTVTVRVMFDDLRADQGGFPTADDLAAVSAYLDTVRPVAVKDFWVVAPIPCPVNFSIGCLSVDSQSTRASIQSSVAAMIQQRAAPGATMWRAWVSGAILEAAGVDYFDLTMNDVIMPNPGSMAVLGDIIYA